MHNASSLAADPKTKRCDSNGQFISARLGNTVYVRMPEKCIVGSQTEKYPWDLTMVGVGLAPATGIMSWQGRGSTKCSNSRMELILLLYRVHLKTVRTLQTVVTVTLVGSVDLLR